MDSQLRNPLDLPDEWSSPSVRCTTWLRPPSKRTFTTKLISVPPPRLPVSFVV